MTLLICLAGLVALFGVAINFGESIVDGVVPAPLRPGEQGSVIEEGPGGLAVANRDYVLRPRTTRFIAGDFTDFRFTIFTVNGKPVTEFASSDGPQMSLVVVRRDMSGYQRLYPFIGPDGTWTVLLRLEQPGSYRAFAHFRPENVEEPVTLGVDLDVPGLVESAPIAKVSSVAKVDGYTVSLTGNLVSGRVSRLWVHVIRGDVPVTDLELNHGNAGHLVILREGDLAYLQVRPVPGPRRETTIAFEAEAPTDGFYRMFLEFQHRGRLRTVEFTAQAR